MTVFLRQSTAVDLAIGPFLDATDGVTAETALTISQADVRLKKNNGAWAQITDATAATHEENGWYEKEFDATDTDTVGRLVVAVHESGALPVWHEFWVLEEAVYDAIFAASAAGYASQASVNTIDDFLDTEMAAVLAAVDTEVAAIKAKTDNLPVSPAAVGSAMTLDLTQALDDTPTTNSTGDALLAARAQGFGKWALVGTTLTLYASDGTTAVKAFTLDSASAPTTRTPA